MACIVKFILCVFAVSLLLFDVGSDWLNGLDMVGLINQTEIINTLSSILPQNITTFQSSKDATQSISDQDERYNVIYGWLTIGITFLPGVVSSVVMLADLGPGLATLIFVLGYIVLYPLVCIYFIIQSHASTKHKYKRYAQIATGNEAFFEAALQLLLQLFIIGYNKEPTHFTLFAITVSFITLSKKVPDWDLANAGINPDGFLRTILSMIMNTPLYGLSIVSRLVCLAVSLVLFRYWALIPLVILNILRTLV